jgi:hypothetical protein
MDFSVKNCLPTKTMSLVSTQPVVKMSTRNIPGGKGGRCIRLTTYHNSVPLSRNLGALNFLDPSGPARPVTGVLYLYLYYCVILLKTSFDQTPPLFFFRSALHRLTCNENERHAHITFISNRVWEICIVPCCTDS